VVLAVARASPTDGTRLVAVLAYRLVTFWLPTVVGGPAYLALRRTLGPRVGAPDER
jgi:uncharacterized membrane protein YbhN (UPF0104 family)